MEPSKPKGSAAQPMLYCYGVSHKSAPLALREQLYLSPEELGPLLEAVKGASGFDELVVLSTCNRIELYAMAPEGAHDEKSLITAYESLQDLAGRPITATSRTWAQCAYYLHGLAATEHVFAVAASLDSLVIGETQITGQFKDAIALASQRKSLGSCLDRLAQEVLATAKKVRSRTHIGEKTVSISHAAIDLAKRVFRDLSEHSFLIVGAGEMARLAALYARKHNPQNIYIANRTLERALGLSESIGVGQAHGLDALAELLLKVDIVISSTSSLHPLIDYKMVKEVMRKRRGKPLFLVDIAMPRDIEANCGSLDDVYLFEIDDLQKVVDENLEERRSAAEEGYALVKRGAAQFEAWLGNVSIKPVLGMFRDYLHATIEREVTKTLQRDLYKDLSPQQRTGLDQLWQAIAGRLVGDAARAINNPQEAMREQLAASLCVLFPQAAMKPQTSSEDPLSRDEMQACQTSQQNH